MTTHTESKHKFSFDDRWHILKYDDHPYYRVVSGRSWRGIDFAGIYEDAHLYLIEVKNFYQFGNDGEIEDVNQFVLEIKEKILDTVDLVQIIEKYHQRKWMYRLWIRLVKRFKELNTNWWFWNRMFEFIEIGSFTFVLLIDSKENMTSLRNQLLLSLKDEDYIIPHVIIQSISKQDLKGLWIRSHP